MSIKGRRREIGILLSIGKSKGVCLMKNLAFTPVTLDGRSEFYELWHKTPRRSLDYSLPNICLLYTSRCV